MPGSIIEKLSESFRRFPGIGPRQAQRFVYYLLHAPPGLIENLVKQIGELKRQTQQCPRCFRFYPASRATKNANCELCLDDSRDHSLLMLVEKDIDLENINRSGTYRGDFFVLGGLIGILDKTPHQSIRSQELLADITRRVAGGDLTEIIIALSANQEGDNTTEFLKDFLKSTITKEKIRLSTLGRGLSTGIELEYSDSSTLKNALKNRES